MLTRREERVNERDTEAENRFTEIERGAKKKERKKESKKKKKEWMKRKSMKEHPRARANKQTSEVYVKSTGARPRFYPGVVRMENAQRGLPLYDSFSLGTLCLGSAPLPGCTAPHSSTTIPNR